MQGGINTYAYVGNNPLGYYDPNGLSAVSGTNSFSGPRGGSMPGGIIVIPVPLPVVVGVCAIIPAACNGFMRGTSQLDLPGEAANDGICEPDDDDPCEEWEMELTELRKDLLELYINGKITELQFQSLRVDFNMQLSSLRKNCPGYGQGIPPL